mmetsp:Transcript_8844/g.17332  ORF Transcript_8844/g.17332 Transcript_8844/m.17332 type:complete len:365 (-) Transcript_8844:90-1184(-)
MNGESFQLAAGLSDGRLRLHRCMTVGVLRHRKRKRMQQIISVPPLTTVSFECKLHDGEITSIMSSASGRELYVLGEKEDSIAAIDVLRRAMTKRIAISEMPTSLAIRDNERSLMVGTQRGHVLVVSKRNFNASEISAHKKPVISVATHPVKGIAVSVAADCTMRSWNVETKEQKSETRTSSAPLGFQWSPSGNLYALGFADWTLVVEYGGRCMGQIRHIGANGCPVAFVNDSCIAAGTEKTPLLYRIDEEKASVTCSQAMQHVGIDSDILSMTVIRCLKSSRDLIAASTTMGDIVVWDLETCNAIGWLPGDGEAVTCLSSFPPRSTFDRGKFKFADGRRPFGPGIDGIKAAASSSSSNADKRHL